MNLNIITPNLFFKFCLIQDKDSLFYFLINTFSVLLTPNMQKRLILSFKYSIFMHKIFIYFIK